MRKIADSRYKLKRKLSSVVYTYRTKNNIFCNSKVTSFSTFVCIFRLNSLILLIDKLLPRWFLPVSQFYLNFSISSECDRSLIKHVPIILFHWEIVATIFRPPAFIIYRYRLACTYTYTHTYTFIYYTYLSRSDKQVSSWRQSTTTTA